MNEIQNQIYFYQCLKNVFFGISIFCLFVTLWIAYGRKRSEKLKGILVITVFLFVGSFVFVQKAEASVQEEKTVTLKMKEGVCLKYTKIYDRDDFSVFQNPETGDILENLEDIEIESAEKSEDVFVKNLEGVLEEKIKDVTEGKKTSVLVTKVELGGKDASKYKVDLEKQQVCLECALTIKKRKINLRVERGWREYGHYNEINFASDTPVQENTESYKNSETEGLLKGDAVVYPTPVEKPIEKEKLPDYSLGEWKERITVKQDGKSGENYYFNYDEVTCGSLQIEPEAIEEHSEYIEFETDRQQVYLDENTGKLWADGKMQDFHVLLKQNNKASFIQMYAQSQEKLSVRMERDWIFQRRISKRERKERFHFFLFIRRIR